MFDYHLFAQRYAKGYCEVLLYIQHSTLNVIMYALIKYNYAFYSICRLIFVISVLLSHSTRRGLSMDCGKHNKCIQLPTVKIFCSIRPSLEGIIGPNYCGVEGEIFNFVPLQV